MSATDQDVSGGWEKISSFNVDGHHIWQIRTPEGERILFARAYEIDGGVALMADPGFLGGKPRNRWAEMRRKSNR